MTKKTVYICDRCGEENEYELNSIKALIQYKVNDAHLKKFIAKDYCSDCMVEMVDAIDSFVNKGNEVIEPQKG